jgi:hypothetical protein
MPQTTKALGRFFVTGPEKQAASTHRQTKQQITRQLKWPGAVSDAQVYLSDEADTLEKPL